MRPLAVVPADPAGVLHALRDSLAGDGPAILVAAPGVKAGAAPLPAEVPRRTALVVETSGSTATPKRVALSSDALLASAAASASDLKGAGQWLLALPVHYVAGLNVLVRSIAAGTEPVVLASATRVAPKSASTGRAPSFDPLAFAAAADSMDAPLRFTSLVPAQLARLLETHEAHESLRRFDRILVGGQATPAPLLARADDLGIRITRTYGSSETGGGCVYDGFPIGNTEVRILDGEIQLSGSVLADGYLGEDERTAASFPVEHGRRWYRTGDTGTFTEGRLRVTGRLDDVIISGGIKVSLADVERIVRGMPRLDAAVVTRQADERWGEVPVVVTEHAAELEDVRARVSAALGPAASPARIIVVDRIPMLASGKPDRREIAILAQ